MTYSRSFEEINISDQFEGFEIEFNDKVTLFPVQVEKQTGSRSSTRRRSEEFGAANVRSINSRKASTRPRVRSPILFRSVMMVPR